MPSHASICARGRWGHLLQRVPHLRAASRQHRHLLGPERSRPGRSSGGELRGRFGRRPPHLRAPDRQHRPLLGRQRLRAERRPRRGVQRRQRRRPALMRCAFRPHDHMLGRQPLQAGQSSRRPVPLGRGWQVPLVRAARRRQTIALLGFRPPLRPGRVLPTASSVRSRRATSTRAGCALTAPSSAGASTSPARPVRPIRPVQRSVSGGPTSHSCGLRADGTVVCWGDSSLGGAECSGRAIRRRHRRLLPLVRSAQTDRTVACWGWGWQDYGESDPPNGHFTEIAAGATPRMRAAKRQYDRLLGRQPRRSVRPAPRGPRRSIQRSERG